MASESRWSILIVAAIVLTIFSALFEEQIKSDRVVWVVFVLVDMGTLTTLAAWALTGWLRERRPRPPGVCPTCGYDLRATPDRCPECGTVPEKCGR